MTEDNDFNGLFVREEQTETKPLRNAKRSPGIIVFLCVLNLLIAGIIVIAAKLVCGNDFAVCMGYVFIPLMNFILCAVDGVLTAKYRWIIAEVGLISVISHMIFVSTNGRTIGLWLLYAACGAAGYIIGSLVRVLASKKAEKNKNNNQGV